MSELFDPAFLFRPAVGAWAYILIPLLAVVSSVIIGIVALLISYLIALPLTPIVATIKRLFFGTSSDLREVYKDCCEKCEICTGIIIVLSIFPSFFSASQVFMNESVTSTALVFKLAIFEFCLTILALILIVLWSLWITSGE